MKKYGKFFLSAVGLCLALMCMILMRGAFASAETGYPEYFLPDQPKTESAVNDFAGIYTEEEIRSFEEKMKVMSQEYDCNVVAVILNNDIFDSSEKWAPENFSEQFLNLDGRKSTVVLWLNICPTNRSLYLLGYGSAEHKIRSDEADEIARSLQGYVKRQQNGESVGNVLYVSMMNAFIEMTDTEMRRPYFFLTWWFHLILGLVLGLIVVCVLVRNIGGKMTADGKTYMNKTFSEVLGRRDIYTHTTYVRTRKSSGGSRGGGGHSHSSGGGRF
ncbi:MAG: TPM domain-containing protein [Roseburia sp.]|nr:TPM domain-containing protein [Roseburia sp.]